MPDTTREPTGDYPHPAPVHHIDLEATADRLLQELPGSQRKTENIARESGVSLILMAMKEGDVLEEHTAPGVVIVQVLRGGIRLQAGSSGTDMGPGQIVMLQPNVPHRHEATAESVVLLTVTGGAD